MQVEKEISPNKRYQMPAPLHFVEHEGHTLVIAPMTANWVVLDNEEQLQFFRLLQQHTIGEALHLFDGNETNAQWVVVQLEARDFEHSTPQILDHGKSVQFHLTNACNMRCPHCYMYAGAKHEEELTYEEIANFLREFRTYGGDHLNFTGGEVRLRKDLFDILQLAHDLGYHIRLLTNGTLWQEEDIVRVKSLVNKVQISLDGYDEEGNAKVRGHGNFDKALQTVERFLHHGVATDIAITPWYDKHFIDNHLEYGYFAKRLRERFPHNNFGVRFTRELLDGRDIQFTAKEKEQYAQLVDRMSIVYWGENLVDEPFVQFHKDKYLEHNCDYGNLTIEANGNIYFCPIIAQQPTILNLRTHSVEEIVRTSDIAKQKSDISNLLPCKDCALIYICGGGCRVKEFEEFRTKAPLSFSQHPVRQCSPQVKRNIYDQMIRTNEMIFS